ncbi:MAG: DinB family protein [Candidatus Solibacter sp.]|nr:DinB family protein [Candidatus Solibacter sp.]
MPDTKSMDALPEPWMRGPIAGVHTLLAPVLYSFQMAREDLAECTASLPPALLWATPHGLASVGFHILHIAGSTNRLMTYLQGRELDAAQWDAMAAEASPREWSRDQLLAALDQAFGDAEAVIRATDPATLAEPRTVGRKRLPTTVIGLLTHIAEHTQRHVGQAIAAAKLAVVV